MDTKQASLTGRCDRVCSEPTRKSRLASLVPWEKPKSSSSASVLALQWCQGDEISESVKALTDDFKNKNDN